jgi:hypothetical protein
MASVLLATAQPYLWDAVNSFNDGVDARFLAMPPARGWPTPAGHAPPFPVPMHPTPAPSSGAVPAPAASDQQRR